MDNDPQYSTPDGSQLRVWRDSASNNFLTGKLGRPMFDEVIYIEVISPGSRGSTPVFEVKRIFDKEMQHEPIFGPQYEQFKQYVQDFEKNEEIDASLSGTPLKEWAEISRTLAASLRASNIFTVEALAELPDEKLSLVGPDGRTWRDKAKAYIENAKGSAYATELAAKVGVLEQEKQDLAAQVKELADRLDAAERAAAAAATPAPPPPPAPTTAAKKQPLADIV